VFVYVLFRYRWYPSLQRRFVFDENANIAYMINNGAFIDIASLWQNE